MQIDPKVDCSAASVVTLAGREWFLPPLAPRQARKVIPALMRLLPKLASLESAASAGLDEATFDELIDIVHVSLTRAYPALSRDEFLDLPIKTTELIAAIWAALKQSGLQSESDVGEAPGETAPASPAP